MGLARQIFNADHDLFRRSFRSFLQQEVVPNQKQWEADGKTPREVWRACGEQGFLVPMAPEAYGGLGLDLTYDAVMLEELAYANESGLLLSLHNCIIAPYILAYASESQKQWLIPGIVNGDIVLAIGMTESGAGSDLAGMKTNAVKKDSHWILNGSKTFISNGLNADVFLIAARTNPNLSHNMGIFIVKPEDTGFQRNGPLKKMGMKSQDTVELFFDNIKLPEDRVLGDSNSGFQYLVGQLPAERLSLCIGSVAAADHAINITVEYVTQRKAFGKPLSKFQNTRFKLAEMRTQVDMAQVYVDRMITAYNDKTLTADVACGAKYWISDLQCRVIDECLQLHGGYGYMEEYPICKMYLDARVSRIYAGTNEIMKTVVAKAMGL